MEIRLSDPNGAEVLSLNGEMQLVGGPGAGAGIRVPHVLNLDGLVFPGPGRYSFDVKVDGEHHVSISLVVDGPPLVQPLHETHPGPPRGVACLAETICRWNR